MMVPGGTPALTQSPTLMVIVLVTMSVFWCFGNYVGVLGTISDDANHT